MSIPKGFEAGKPVISCCPPGVLGGTQGNVEAYKAIFERDAHPMRRVADDCGYVCYQPLQARCVGFGFGHRHGEDALNQVFCLVGLTAGTETPRCVVSVAEGFFLHCPESGESRQLGPSATSQDFFGNGIP